MTSSQDNSSRSGRVVRAVWVGWLGGIAWGAGEAWEIFLRNAGDPGAALAGVIGAMGFVIALDGALGALVMGALGAVAAQVNWLRRRFDDAASWTSLCAAAFGGLLLLVGALSQLGVLSGATEGLRTIMYAGLSLIVAAAGGAIVYGLARAALASAGDRLIRVARGAVVALWIVAALIPLAFALLRSRLA